MMKIFTDLFIIFIFFSYSLADDLVFDHLTVDNGLPANTVNDIKQDSLGFIWLATRNGLVKYDGFEFELYQYQENKINGLLGNNIYCIYEDQFNQLWIGSYTNGLYKYNRESNDFTHFEHNPDDPESISSNNIQRILEDSYKNFWVATFGGGLNLYDNESKTFNRFQHSQDDPNSLSDNFILDLYEDQRGTLWIGTINGLNKFDRDKKTFIKYFNNPDDPNSLSADRVYCVYEDSFNNLWIGTASGLNTFDRKTGKFKRYYNQPNIPGSVSHNRIACIYEDSEQNLWIGTSGGGLNKYNHKSDSFIQYTLESPKTNQFGGKYIRKIYEDKTGILWIGTVYNGLKKIDKSLQRIKHIDQFSKNSIKQENSWALSACETEDKSIWIGSADGNLVRFNQTENTFSYYKIELESNIKGFKVINDLLATKNGMLYLATSSGLLKFNYNSGKILKEDLPINRYLGKIGYKELANICQGVGDEIWIGSDRRGVFKYNEKTQEITHFEFDRDNVNSLSNNNVFCLFKDSRQNIWIGTNRGLNKYQPETNNFKRFMVDTSVTCVFEAMDSTLWVGTFIGGICSLNQKTESFVSYSDVDWLTTGTIYSMLQDDSGNLWLAMERGILKLDLKNQSQRIYTEEDGLAFYRFRYNSVFKASDGMFYFGSFRGLNYFNPNQLIQDSVAPQVVLTGFKMSNQSIPFGENMPLQKYINVAASVQLEHWQNDITIDYSSLYFSQPSRNSHAYIMENWDKEWRIVEDERSATYSNLSPGEYIFKVIAANKDGIWNVPPKELKITIFPPFWKTWWAYSLYFLFLLGIYFAVRKYELNRLRLKHDLEMKDAETNKLMELDQLKSRFFVNISHEFRTPLTLILGNMDKLNNYKLTAELKNQYEIITRNAKRLLRLVNQLLDFSKIDAGKMKLQVAQYDIIKVIKPIVLSFQSLAEQQQKKLVLKCEPEEITGYFDHDKIEKILYNLLSNAFKFTSNNDQITVSISQSKNTEICGNHNCLQLTIEDSGTGIKQEDLDKIFEIFQQVNNTNNFSNEGTGIGLALSNELVEIHRGKISVQSEFGKYTRFVITFPIDRNCYSEKEIIAEPVFESEIENKNIVDINESQPVDNSDQTDEELPLLLIVEDNHELRAFIKGELIVEYKIIEAENGEEGFQKAINSIPDIIISDVMMPVMDGFEFAKKIKADIVTNHIPIILLTARVSDESKIEGLETGADDFLAKPFSSVELKIKLKNMINHQNRMHEKFRREFLLEPGEIKFDSPDEQFIKNITEIIESNLNKSDFSVEELSKQINMSRIHLYRKTKAITGQSCSDFVRSYKLKRAAQLLIHDEYTISEICYMTGFSEPSNFSKVFKKQYGKSPSRYLENYKTRTNSE